MLDIAIDPKDIDYVALLKRLKPSEFLGTYSIFSLQALAEELNVSRHVLISVTEGTRVDSRLAKHVYKTEFDYLEKVKDILRDLGYITYDEARSRAIYD